MHIYKILQTPDTRHRQKWFVRNCKTCPLEAMNHRYSDQKNISSTGKLLEETGPQWLSVVKRKNVTAICAEMNMIVVSSVESDGRQHPLQLHGIVLHSKCRVFV